MYQHRRKQVLISTSTSTFTSTSTSTSRLDWDNLFNFRCSLAYVHLSRTQNWTKNNILFVVCFSINRFRLISFHFSSFLSSFLWYPSSQIIALHSRKQCQKTNGKNRASKEKNVENSVRFHLISKTFFGTFSLLFLGMHSEYIVW